jgi:hypothetical protein
MVDLPLVHRQALKSLVGRERDGTLYRTSSGNYGIRQYLGLKAFSARDVRLLMRRLAQAGLVSPEWVTKSGAVLGWCITPAGLAALETPRRRHHG